MKVLGSVVCVMLLAISAGVVNAGGHGGYKKVCVAGIVSHTNGKGRVVWSKHKSGKSFQDHINHGDSYHCTKYKRVRKPSRPSRPSAS